MSKPYFSRQSKFARCPAERAFLLRVLVDAHARCRVVYICPNESKQHGTFYASPGQKTPAELKAHPGSVGIEDRRELCQVQRTVVPLRPVTFQSSALGPLHAQPTAEPPFSVRQNHREEQRTYTSVRGVVERREDVGTGC